jgi:hypothetical protein
LGLPRRYGRLARRRLSVNVSLRIATERSIMIMYIDDFVWLPDIVEKFAVQHHVTQDEVEEVFFNRPRYRFVESGHRIGEDVYAASGQTDAGRYLIVFFCVNRIIWRLF